MKKVVISKKDLKNNLKMIRADLTKRDDNGNKVRLIAVVKDNGMGLDLIKYSEFLVDNGVDFLAVATVEEAIKLRQAGITVDILMLSPVNFKSELEVLIENKIIITIDNKKQIELCEKNFKDKNIRAHIKIDTGFGRYGFLYDNKNEIVEAMKMCKNIKIEGMYTHFSKALDTKWTYEQFNRFLDVIAIVRKNGLNPGLLHCCNSTAFMLYKNMYLNAVRLGSIIQGRTLVGRKGLVKVGVFKTYIAEIKTVPKGYNISYGKNFKTRRETKIAVIPVGYVDGLNSKKNRDSFKLSENIVSALIEFKKVFKDNRIKVKINEKEYNVIGRLGMYHAVIDVTDSDIDIGDEVIVDINPLNANSDVRREYA